MFNEINTHTHTDMFILCTLYYVPLFSLFLNIGVIIKLQVVGEGKIKKRD